MKTNILLDKKTETAREDDLITMSARKMAAEKKIAATLPYVLGYEKRMREIKGLEGLARVEQMMSVMRGSLDKHVSHYEKYASKLTKIYLGANEVPLANLEAPGQVRLRHRWAKATFKHLGRGIKHTERVGLPWEVSVLLLASHCHTTKELPGGLTEAEALWLAVDPWDRLLVIEAQTDVHKCLGLNGKAVLAKRHSFSKQWMGEKIRVVSALQHPDLVADMPIDLLCGKLKEIFEEDIREEEAKAEEIEKTIAEKMGIGKIRLI